MVFRNDPCPCGSSKKYKKCCLRKAKRAEHQRQKLEETATVLALADFLREANVLDDLSNSVLDLIDDKRLPEALAVCERLLREYPDVVDGLEHSGVVYEELGDLEKARDFYTRALAFTQRPDQRDDFDDRGTPSFCRERIAAIDVRLGGER